jgi:CxxC motif-containing protein
MKSNWEELEMFSKDVFTSLVRIKGNPNYKVVSVKSNKVIEKYLWREFSKVLSRIYVSTPINIGDIICKNIMNTGVDIICTKKID